MAAIRSLDFFGIVQGFKEDIDKVIPEMIN